MSVAKYLLRSFCKNMLYPALFQTHPQAYAHYDLAVSPPRSFTALPPASFPWRVPKRFFGIRDFPYLKLRVRDFKAKSGKIRDWTLCAGVRMREINLGITGLKNPIKTLVHVRFHLQIRFYTNLFARSIGSGWKVIGVLPLLSNSLLYKECVITDLIWIFPSSLEHFCQTQCHFGRCMSPF